MARFSLVIVIPFLTHRSSGKGKPINFEEKLTGLSWNVREQHISLYLQGLIATKVTGQKLF